MTKPFRVDEVVAQVDALVQMAARLRAKRDSPLSIAPAADYSSNAIEGDLRQMSIATVLSMLGMERRTGVFEVVSKKRRAQIEIAGGYIVFGTVGGTRVTAVHAMRVMLSWKVGRFSFSPLPPCEVPPGLRTVQAILLDAAKAEDEAAANAGLSPVDGRIVSSSLGGPPSRPDDTGPPSSRAMREVVGGPASMGTPSIAFDLVPTRRPEALPAAEVSAAVDPSIAAYERGQARPVTPNPPIDSEPPTAPKVPPQKRVSPSVRPTAKGSKGGGRGPASSRGRRGVDSSRVTQRMPHSPLDLDEVFEAENGVDSGSISVDLEDFGPPSVGERMLLDEQHDKTPKVPQIVERGAPRVLPTPPAGTALPNLRRTPAIAPPPAVDAPRARPFPPHPPPRMNIPRPPPMPRPVSPVADKSRTKKG